MESNTRICTTFGENAQLNLEDPIPTNVDVLWIDAATTHLHLSLVPASMLKTTAIKYI
jgi:hypothetical protein